MVIQTVAGKTVARQDYAFVALSRLSRAHALLNYQIKGVLGFWGAASEHLRRAPPRRGPRLRDEPLPQRRRLRVAGTGSSIEERRRLRRQML